MARPGLIIFGPYSLWRTFWFCVRLRMHDVEYTMCKNPWSVAVPIRMLNQATALSPEKKTRG